MLCSFRAILLCVRCYTTAILNAVCNFGGIYELKYSPDVDTRCTMESPVRVCQSHPKLFSGVVNIVVIVVYFVHIADMCGMRALIRRSPHNDSMLTN